MVAATAPAAAPATLFSPRTSELARKPSVPRANELAKMAPRSNKNHIMQNRRTASQLHPPAQPQDAGPYRHKSFGAVPDYLQVRSRHKEGVHRIWSERRGCGVTTGFCAHLGHNGSKAQCMCVCVLSGGDAGEEAGVGG